MLNLGVEGMMLVGAVAAFAVAATTQVAVARRRAPAWCAGARAVADLRGADADAAWRTRSPPGSRCRCSASGCRRSSACRTCRVVIERDPAAGDSRLVRPAGASGKLLFAHNPLVYLSLAAVRGRPVVPVPHARRARAARGRRVAAVGARDRLSGHRASATSPCCSAARAPGSAAPICRSRYTPLWVEGMTAGRGWIALALVVFATWKPWRVLAGAYLFGGVTLAQFQAQALGVDDSRRSSCRCCRTSRRSSCSRSFRATRRPSGSTRRRRSAGRSIADG